MAVVVTAVVVAVVVVFADFQIDYYFADFEIEKTIEEQTIDIRRFHQRLSYKLGSSCSFRLQS